MAVSVEAKKILNKVLDLKEVADLEFLLEKTRDALRLRSDAMIGDGMNEADALLFQSRARKVFDDITIELNSPESALLAAWLFTNVSGNNEFTSRQITMQLGEERKVSNITKAMESLTDKKYVALTSDSIDSQGHKTFYLLKEGTDAVFKLVEEKHL